MREREREALAETILAMAGDAGCEAIVTSEASGLTRFTQNAVHQNVASEDVAIRVRIVRDGRTGVAATNARDEASLRALVARATEIAALAPHDPIAPPLARAAHAATPAGAYVAATADATPERRAAIAAEIIAASERASLWAAGYVTTSRSGITIANSAGTRASYDGTTCGLNVKANGADATGFAECYGNDVALLDGAAAGTRAAQKALAGAAPVAIEPGAYTVILEPAAIGELLSYLTDHFSAQSFDEGSSFLSGALGDTFAGPNATIGDDYADPRLAGMPFDYEGFPRARLPLLESGGRARDRDRRAVRGEARHSKYRPRSTRTERCRPRTRARDRRVGFQIARATHRGDRERHPRESILVHPSRRRAQDDRHGHDARRNLRDPRRRDRGRRA